MTGGPFGKLRAPAVLVAQNGSSLALPNYMADAVEHSRASIVATLVEQSGSGRSHGSTAPWAQSEAHGDGGEEDETSSPLECVRTSWSRPSPHTSPLHAPHASQRGAVRRRSTGTAPWSSGPSFASAHASPACTRPATAASESATAPAGSFSSACGAPRRPLSATASSAAHEAARPSATDEVTDLVAAVTGRASVTACTCNDDSDSFDEDELTADLDVAEDKLARALQIARSAATPSAAAGAHSSLRPPATNAARRRRASATGGVLVTGLTGSGAQAGRHSGGSQRAPLQVVEVEITPSSSITSAVSGLSTQQLYIHRHSGGGQVAAPRRTHSRRMSLGPGPDSAHAYSAGVGGGRTGSATSDWGGSGSILDRKPGSSSGAPAGPAAMPAVAVGAHAGVSAVGASGLWSPASSSPVGTPGHNRIGSSFGATTAGLPYGGAGLAAAISLPSPPAVVLVSRGSPLGSQAGGGATGGSHSADGSAVPSLPHSRAGAGIGRFGPGAGPAQAHGQEQAGGAGSGALREASGGGGGGAGSNLKGLFKAAKKAIKRSIAGGRDVGERDRGPRADEAAARGLPPGALPGPALAAAVRPVVASPSSGSGGFPASPMNVPILQPHPPLAIGQIPSQSPRCAAGARVPPPPPPLGSTCLSDTGYGALPARPGSHQEGPLEGRGTTPRQPAQCAARGAGALSPRVDISDCREEYRSRPTPKATGPQLPAASQLMEILSVGSQEAGTAAGE